ncbi:DUF4190 domain-containing protein [Phycisphaeraceae bacterium D3-23]
MNDPFDLDEPAYPAATPQGHIQRAGFNCTRCGYDLTGSVIGGTCPECGTHINPQHHAHAPNNSMAITSMVMGILSFVITPILFAPLGIIFGHIAQKQIRTGRYATSSRGYALTGLICSYIALGLVLVVGAIFILIIIFS